MEESDDSNDENNWRNDYPEESDHESVTEDDMVEAVKRITIDDNLSSDDGEEGCTYGVDNEKEDFEKDIDPSDVEKYGRLYAWFKAKNTSEPYRSNTYYRADLVSESDEEYN